MNHEVLPPRTGNLPRTSMQLVRNFFQNSSNESRHNPAPMAPLLKATDRNVQTNSNSNRLQNLSSAAAINPPAPVPNVRRRPRTVFQNVQRNDINGQKLLTTGFQSARDALQPSRQQPQPSNASTVPSTSYNPQIVDISPSRPNQSNFANVTDNRLRNMHHVRNTPSRATNNVSIDKRPRQPIVVSADIPECDVIDLSSQPEECDVIEQFTNATTQSPTNRKSPRRQSNVPVVDGRTHNIRRPLIVSPGQPVRFQAPPVNQPIRTDNDDDDLFAQLDVDSMIAERRQTSNSSNPGPVNHTPQCKQSIARTASLNALEDETPAKDFSREIESLKRRIIAVHDNLFDISCLLAMDIDQQTVARYTQRRNEQQKRLKELNDELSAMQSKKDSTTPSSSNRYGQQVFSTVASPITPANITRPTHLPSSVKSLQQPSLQPNSNINEAIAIDVVERSNTIAIESTVPINNYNIASVTSNHEVYNSTNVRVSPEFQQTFENRERPDNLPVNTEALLPTNAPMPEEDIDLAAFPEPDEDLPMVFTPTKAPQEGTLREIRGTQTVPKGANDNGEEWRESRTKKFPWSMNLLLENKRIFGNTGFRPNQREAMNAALSGKNVFVLMPTGGGKSLCYQLPSLLRPGVAIVVSPLVSLIQDQIRNLWDKQIPCGALTSATPQRMRNELMKDLHNSTPMTKMVYVTPEKITRSPAFFDLLNSLSKRKLLQRFVIDEAHCVSQWGHDFRPDYKQLAVFKQKFPEVPIMALTATATSEVKEDIKVQLRISRDCVMFQQSFNRTNLVYEVRKKKKDTVDEIGKEIKSQHRNQAGIIYCFSQKECETVAQNLYEKCQLKALPYHAGLSDAKRRNNQDAWSSGEVKIICSTLAFGMGIDKADVRFVYHYTMPKNIEGYYQESGRAGRDGKISRCVLYFTLSDRFKVLSMIMQDAPGGNPYSRGRGRGKNSRRNDRSSSFASRGTTNEGQVLRNTQNLARMTAYCLNDITCRRTQLLAHFSEQFDSKNCNPKCDNCQNIKGIIRNIDVTEHGIAIAEVIGICENGRRNSGQSAAYIVELYMGRKSRVKDNHMSNGHFGGGKRGHLKDTDIYQIIEELCAQQIVQVHCEINKYGGVQSELLLNPCSSGLEDLRSRRTKITLQTRATGKQNNGVSNNIRHTSTKRPRSRDDNIEDEIEENDFEQKQPTESYTSPFFQKAIVRSSTSVKNQAQAIAVSITGNQQSNTNQTNRTKPTLDNDDVNCRTHQIYPNGVPKARSVRPPPTSRSKRKRLA